MKVLFYEDPNEHRVKADFVVDSLRRKGLEAIEVHTLPEADRALRENDFDFVIVHQSGDFEPISILRTAHTKPKYAGYSGMLNKQAKPGSVADAVREKMEKHYDLVLYDDIVGDFYDAVGIKRFF